MTSSLRLQRRLLATSSSAEALKFHLSKGANNEDTLKKPIVMMIGWAGADPKHVEKYTNIYTNNGFHVASICPPRYHFEVPDSSIGRQIMPIFEKCENRKIVIHSFSMNGIRGIISFWKAAGNLKFEETVDGIIFDSAPSRPLSYQNGKAMMLSRPSVSFLSNEQRAKIHEKIEDLRNFLLWPILKYSPLLRPQFSLFWFLQDKIRLPKHQLYLYSTADSMVPVENLKKFISRQKSRGNDVEEHDFGETEHVAHFRSRPDIYEQKCLAFMNKSKL